MPQLVQVIPTHFIAAQAVDSFQAVGGDLMVHIASSPKAIQVPGMTAERFRAQFPPAIAARFLAVDRTFVSLSTRSLPLNMTARSCAFAYAGMP